MIHYHRSGKQGRFKARLLFHLRGVTTFALLLTFFLTSSAETTTAQTVSFNYKRTRLADALNDIAKQSKHQFIYDAAWFKDQAPVTLQATDMPWQKALDAVLEGRPFSYKVYQDIITLSRKQDADKNNAIDTAGFVLQGRVLDDQNKPLPGVTVGIKGSEQYTRTNENGQFTLPATSAQDVVVFTSIGFERKEIRIGRQRTIDVKMDLQVTKLDEVVVPYNTGYQTISQERATGAFSQVDNKLFNRRVGKDVLSRLDGIVPGVFFDPANTALSSTGISVRGQSSVSGYVNMNPLIVLDNFPYEGSLSNINPNDVATVTVLKDAAAASIWGARAANGVVVITTKSGSYNQKMRLDFNTNVTVGMKPDLSYDKTFLPATPYLEAERYLFGQGYYDALLTDTWTYPAMSPAIEILTKQRDGLLTAQEADRQLSLLANNDLRNDYKKHLLRNSVQQQYAVNLRGGGNNQAYYLGVGYDQDATNYVKNKNSRFTIKTEYRLTPIKNLEVNANIYYSQQNASTPNDLTWGSLSGNYPRAYPYAQLADEQGNPLAISRAHRTGFLDSLEKLGLLNWRYRPLEEINIADRTSTQQSILLVGGVKYRIANFLSIEGRYQRETQTAETRNLQREESFFARNLINTYAQYNATAKTFKFPFPRGGVLNQGFTKLQSNNFRGQLNLNHRWSDHDLNGIVGTEIRQTTTDGTALTYYGYNDEYGSAASNIDYVTNYPTNGGFGGFVPAPINSVRGTTQRYISYFGNLAYSYLDRYTVTVSGRRDGANIFGVRTNDRITPFWSAGLSWEMSKETFYDISWLPFAKLRATYGYNGNVYNGGAYLIASFGRTSNITNLPFGTIVTAPNPELRWEKVANLNLGFDFRLKNDVLTGSIDWYQKKGTDLVDDVTLATSTGFTSYRGNAASTRTTGIDIGLNSNNLQGAFKWQTNLVLSLMKSKVLKFEGGQRNARVITGNYGGATLVGHDILGFYSYRWAGLDPQTGDPQGYVGKTISKDYTAILDNKNFDSLVYHGSARPQIYGGLRNTFTWKGISVSANVVFKFKYFYRRPTVNTNYQELLSAPNAMHVEYMDRWQQPGDEQHTSVPSMVYLTNPNRAEFYRYSEITVSKADHIRLQDIRLSYDLGQQLRSKTFSNIQVYFYANNLGILWKANHDGLDPDYTNTLVAPKTFAAGVQIGL